MNELSWLLMCFIFQNLLNIVPETYEFLPETDHSKPPVLHAWKPVQYESRLEISIDSGSKGIEVVSLEKDVKVHDRTEQRARHTPEADVAVDLNEVGSDDNQRRVERRVLEERIGGSQLCDVDKNQLLVELVTETSSEELSEAMQSSEENYLMSNGQNEDHTNTIPVKNSDISSEKIVDPEQRVPLELDQIQRETALSPEYTVKERSKEAIKMACNSNSFDAKSRTTDPELGNSVIGHIETIVLSKVSRDLPITSQLEKVPSALSSPGEMNHSNSFPSSQLLNTPSISINNNSSNTTPAPVDPLPFQVQQEQYQTNPRRSESLTIIESNSSSRSPNRITKEIMLDDHDVINLYLFYIKNIPEVRTMITMPAPATKDGEASRMDSTATFSICDFYSETPESCSSTNSHSHTPEL